MVTEIHEEISAAAIRLGVFVCPSGYPAEYYLKKAAKQYVQNCLAKGISPNYITFSQEIINFLREENWISRRGGIIERTIIRYGNVETKAAVMVSRVGESGFDQSGSNRFNLYDYAVVVGCVDNGSGMGQGRVALRLALENGDEIIARLIEEIIQKGIQG